MKGKINIYLNKHTLFVLWFALSPFFAYSQKHSLTLGLGNSMFLGDLGGSPQLGSSGPLDLNVQSMRYSLSASYSNMFSNQLGLRFSAGYMRLSGDDRYTQNSERRQRNLSFYTPIVSASSGVVFYPFTRARLYFFGGVGLFYFEPKTTLNGQVYKLRKYGTEGQYFMPGRKPYNPVAVFAPFGFGYRMFTGRKNNSLNLEFTFCKSFSDYVDDASTFYVDKTKLEQSNGAVAVQLSDRSNSNIPSFSLPGGLRGNPNNMDNFSTIQLSYTIPLSHTGWIGMSNPVRRSRYYSPGSYWFLGAGPSMFLGDLGGSPGIGRRGPVDLNFWSTRYSFTLGYTKMLYKNLGFRMSLGYARISGNDKFTKYIRRFQRNLSFYTPIVEAYGAFEYYPITNRRLYFLGGVGAFYYEPKTRLNGRVYRVRAYGTEGQYFVPQKSVYNPVALIFPFGAGYKLIDRGVSGPSLRVEFRFSKSTTDYMDDASTVFVDKELLKTNNGYYAVLLMDRSWSDHEWFSVPDAIRGNPKNKDNYTFLHFIYTVPVGFNFNRFGCSSKQIDAPKGTTPSGSLTLGFGGTFFLGDLGGTVKVGRSGPIDLDYETIRYAFSVGYTHMFSSRLGWRSSLTYGRLSGADKYTLNDKRRQRNLSFFTPLVQGVTGLEYYIDNPRRFYAFGSFGLFAFNPKTRLNGTVYKLHEYGTEGQYFVQGREPYRRVAFVFPVGLGYTLARNTQTGAVLKAELSFTKNTSDYVDDVSWVYVDKTQLEASNGPVAVQLMDRSNSSIIGYSAPGAIRGNPNNMDNYTMLQFVLSVPVGKPNLSFGDRRKPRRSKSRVFWPGRF